MRYVHIGLLLVLTVGQAHSQMNGLPEIGTLLNPSDNIPLYNAAPNAFLRRQVPTGILNPSSDGIRLYPLTPSENGFQVQEPTGALGSVMITDHIDILQNGVVTRWFRVSEATRDSVLGWTYCADDNACSTLFGLESDD